MVHSNGSRFINRLFRLHRLSFCTFHTDFLQKLSWSFFFPFPKHFYDDPLSSSQTWHVKPSHQIKLIRPTVLHDANPMVEAEWIGVSKSFLRNGSSCLWSMRTGPKMTEEVIFNQTYPQHTNIVTFVLIYNYEISQTGIWVKCWKILEKLEFMWVFFFFLSRYKELLYLLFFVFFILN